MLLLGTHHALDWFVALQLKHLEDMSGWPNTKQKCPRQVLTQEKGCRVGQLKVKEATLIASKLIRLSSNLRH